MWQPLGLPFRIPEGELEVVDGGPCRCCGVAHGGTACWTRTPWLAPPYLQSIMWGHHCRICPDALTAAPSAPRFRVDPSTRQVVDGPPELMRAVREAHREASESAPPPRERDRHGPGALGGRHGRQERWEADRWAEGLPASQGAEDTGVGVGGGGGRGQWW